MEQVIQLISANPWFTIVAALCSVISVPLAIIFYLKSRKDKLPRFAFKSTNIIAGMKEKIPAVTIRFAGHDDDIESLTVTKVLFWNGGTEAIKREDVVSPITVRLTNGRIILDATPIQHTTNENNFSVTTSPDKTSATITFDYIDKGEGAVFQFFHTGLSDKDISFEGRIIGAGIPIRMFVSQTGSPQKKPPHVPTARQLTYLCGSLLAGPFVALGLLLFVNYLAAQEIIVLTEPQPPPPQKPMPFVLQIVLLSILVFPVCWIMAYVIWTQLKLYRLRTFFQEF